MVESILIALSLILLGSVDDWFTRHVGPRFFYSGVTLLLMAAGASMAAGLPALSRFPFRNPFRVPWLPLYVAVIGLAAYLRWRVISRWPISAQDADMLPAIQQAIQRLLQGQNPYGQYLPSDLIPWEVWLVYLPGLWLAYLPASLMDVDFRIWGLFWVGGLVAVHFLYLRKHREPWSIASFILLALFLLVPKSFNFVRIGHTFPYWFAIACFCFSALRKKYAAASVWAGIAALMRILFAPLLLLWCAFLWKRRSELDFRKNVSLSLLVWIGGQLPFFLADPGAYLYGTIVWYDLTARFAWETSRLSDTFGFTSMLEAAGRVEAYRWLGPGIFLPLLILASKRVRDEADLLIWSGTLLLAISFLTPVPYYYIYFPPYILFIFGASGRWARQARIGAGA